MLRSILLLVLLPASVLAAQDPRGLLHEANELYRSLKYERAMAVATRVLKSDESRPSDVVEAYRITGLCQSARGKEEDAMGSFRRLLAIEPDFVLGADVSPKLAAFFYRAKALSVHDGSISIRHVKPDVLGKDGTDLDVVLGSNPFQMVSSVRLRWWAKGGDPMTMNRVPGKDGKASFNLPAGLQAQICYDIEALNEFGATLKILGEAEPFCLDPGKIEKDEKIIAKSDKTPKAGKGDKLQVHGTEKQGTEKQELSSASDDKEKFGPDSKVSVLSKSDDSHGARDLGTRDPENTRMFEAGQGREAPAGIEQDHWYTSWWFWTAVGVVVLGAATTTTVMLVDGSGSSTDYEIKLCVGCR